jgi:gliding motility-associated-like protein
MLLMAFLFVPQKSFAAVCFGSASVSTSTTKICGTGTATLTLTAASAIGGSGSWTADYQWEVSTDGGSTWTAVSGATGSLSSPSPTTASYVTPVYTATATCATYTYHAVISNIVNNCSGSIPFYTTPVNITVCSSAGTLSGPTKICSGTCATLSSTVAGGTWSSSSSAALSFGTASVGIACGGSAGFVNVTYTVPNGCFVTSHDTVAAPAATLTGSHTVCFGSTNTVNTGGISGTWTSSNPIDIPIVGNIADSGLTVGATATITYTTAGTGAPFAGCYATYTQTVVANPAHFANDTLVCAGTSLTFTAPAGGGGTWISTNGPCVNIGSASGIANATGSGAPCVAPIYYQFTSTGCRTAALVSVNPTPAAITGYSTPICANTTLTLSDATSGGTWSSSNPAVGTIDASGVFTALAPPSTTITYTLPTGCYSTKLVSVNSLPSAITTTGQVCVGATITATESPTGTWVSSNTSVATISPASGLSTTITGVAAGTSTLTFTVGGTGCQALSVITVNAAPSVPTPPTAVCIASTATLSDATTGGTWSSSNNTLATVGSATGVVTGQAAGNPFITYTAPTGCTSRLQITVNALPAAPGGTLSLCVNSTTTLTDATGAGTWSSSDATIATVGSSNGVVFGVAPGTAAISFTLTSTGCVSTVVVTVNALPAAIGGLTPVCPAQCTTLTDATSGGTWSTSAGTGSISIGSASGQACGIAAGTANVTYTLATTGCRITAVMTVNTPAAPIAGTPSICVGSCTSLTNAITGGTWASSNTAIGTIDASGVACGVTPGTTTITYTPPSGCAAVLIVTVNALPPNIGGVLSVCVGATSTLTNTTGGGTWASSTTGIATIGSANGALLGVAPGTSTITYTLPTGCFTTAVATVNAAPGPITGTLSVCSGQSTALINTIPGGTWSSSDATIASVNASTGLVTGGNPGTATITYTLSGSCSITAVVTTNPLPAAITGSGSVCIGSTTTLTTTTPGGTWISGDMSIATIGNTTGIVTGQGLGVTTITYMLTGTGCYTVTTVTVNTAPTTISGPSSVCVGNTATLTHSVTGGTWVSSNPAAGTVSTTGVVTGIASGTTNITYTLPGGCYTVKAFTVNALPAAITGAGSVCVASTITLSDATPGGTWSPSNTNATINASGIVTGVSSGTTTITYTVSGTGCFVTTDITVNPSPGAISGSLAVCVGNCTTLSNPTTGGTWSISNATVASVGSSTGIICGLTAGTTIVTYTAPTGCRALTTVTVSGLPAAITGTLLVCPGLTTSLSTTTVGGTWSTSDNTVAIVNTSGLVIGIGPGTASICYTTGTGCSRCVVVTVNPLPAPITGNLAICVGGNTSLTDGTPGGTWSSSNTTVASIGTSTGVVSGIATGTSRITYKISATGCNVTADVTVNAAPPAIGGSLSICTGFTTSLTDAATGGTWTSGNLSVATIGSSTGVATGIIPGTSTIVYNVSAGCSTSATLTVNATPVAIVGPSTVCIGSTITLTDATPGGSWSSSNTTVATIGSATGVVTGLSAGTAIISYLMPSGCVATTIITVNALPAPITGTTSICQGATTTLADASAPGTWSSSDITVATIGTGGDVIGLGGGTTTITFTETVTSCFTTTILSVNPLPAPIGGPLSVCEGLTTTLTDVTPGGIWTSSDPSSASINGSTGFLTGLSGGVSGTVVTITYTLGSGCFVTTPFTVNPLPAGIAGTLTGCVGLTTTLTNASAGGSWSISPVTVATVNATTGVVTGIAAGTAVVTYTLPTGCLVTTLFTVNAAPEPIAGTFSVCQGFTTTLAEATTGGTWSSSNGFIATIGSATGIVTGISPGTVIITYTAPSGCYITHLFSVYPIPPAYTGNLVVCQGQTTTLSDVTTGGTWTSNMTTIATVGSASGVVTGIMGYGTATITYTLPTGCYVTDVVTVNPLPSVITGTMHTCDSSSTTLVDVTPGGVWSSSDNTIATIDSNTGVVSGWNPGTVTISYTLTATGCYVTTTFVVDPLPTVIGGTLTVCVGQTTLLTNGLGGITWTSLNIGVATINPGTGLVTGISAGTATIVATSPAGCTRTTVVTVNPLPAAITGIHSICVHSSATLSDATLGGTWSSSNPTVASIGTNGVYTGNSAGTATITYTAPSTGCFITTVVTVNPNPAGILGQSAVCLHSTTVLSDPTIGGAWSLSSTTVATITATTPAGDSIFVLGIDTGHVTVSYILPTGCGTTFILTVDPLPSVIGGTLAVCKGSTTTLTDSVTGGTWTSGNPGVATIDAVTGVVTGVDTGTATITYMRSSAGLPAGSGCYVTAVVTVNPLPTAMFGPTDVCAGFTITLHDTTAGGFFSTVDTTVATIDSFSGVVTAINAGTAVITYTLFATGCDVTRVVNVHPIPEVTVNRPGMICRKASVLLTATGAGAGATYTWAPPTGLSCTNCASPVASPTITTTYTVTGSTVFGCSDTAVVTIMVDSLLDHISVTGKNGVCAGTCDTLYALGFPPGSLFAWKPAAGLSCTICDTVIACPDVTRTYNAVAIDSFGCRDSVSFTVTVNPLPVLDVLPRPAFVCKGKSTQLQAFSSVFGTTYAWFPNIFLSCDSCSNPIASDTFNLVYRVIGTTPFGCYDSIKVPVSVLEDAINTITSDTIICRGQSVRLDATSFNADGSSSGFLWLPPTGLNANNIPTPIATPDATTTYTLVVTPNACFSDTLQVTVGIAEYPAIDITPKNSTVVAGTSVPLTATITNGVIISSFAWSPSSTLSCEACYSTIATPTVNTTYTFSAVSNYGCASSNNGTINIFCDGSEVFIPNTFTPNGDGMNDRFYVSAKGISSIVRMSVYNRWGELVFEAHNISPNNPGMGWDGTYKGMVLAPDVFVVVVDALCELGQPFHYQADVSIVR